MVRIAAMAALAASLLVVTGCAATVPAPLTPKEVAEFEQEMDYQHWNVTGLDDGPPDMPRGDYVSPAEFEAEFPNCLLDAQVSGNGEFAEYTCYKRLPLSPADQGYFSGDERLALYDYFQNTLVPCMELHGIDVMDAPRRAAVADGPGFLEWHPFWTTAIPEPSLIAIEGSCARLPDWAWAH